MLNGSKKARQAILRPAELIEIQLTFGGNPSVKFHLNSFFNQAFSP